MFCSFNQFWRTIFVSLTKLDWRSRKTFEDNSCSRPSFPDITFFWSTPPPQNTAAQTIAALTPSSPAAAATVSASPAPPKAITRATSSNPTTSSKPEFHFQGETTQINSTSSNPFRLTRRQIVFSATPTFYTGLQDLLHLIGKFQFLPLKPLLLQLWNHQKEYRPH